MYCLNNLFIVKSTLKIFIQVLKLLQKNFECSASKPNAHGTFWNLHIKINFKMNISETNRSTDVKMSSAHSPTFPSLHVRHSAFSNPSSLYLRHSWFSNPSVASPTSQLIPQPVFRFSYVTCSSLTSLGEPPMNCIHPVPVQYDEGRVHFNRKRWPPSHSVDLNV